MTRAKLSQLFRAIKRVGVLCCASAALTVGLASNAQAHDRYGYDVQIRGIAPAASYAYIYYPEQQVYFSPLSREWFWWSAGNWQSAAYLPRYLSVNTRWGGVPITLRSARPYYDHVFVERAYGRPWRESHGYAGEFNRHRHEWNEERREERREEWHERRYDGYRR